MKIRALLYSMIATFAVVFSACDDDLNSLGNNIRPDSDSISVDIDTVFNITAETYSLDNKIYARTTKGVIGDYTDPLLGRVRSEYLCEFYCPENIEFHDKLFAIDSVQVNIVFTSYSGDSLAPMGITAYEVDKKILDNIAYTNIDPTEYSSMSKVFAKGSYSIKNTPKSGSYRIITADADTTKGWEFFNTWKTNPEYFKDSKAFRDNMLKGLYITSSYGSGALVNVDHTLLDIYYRFNAGKKVNEDTDSIGYGLFSIFVSSEVTQMNRVENKIDLANLNSYTDRTFIKTPAGLCTKLNIPIAEIKEKMGDNTNLNAATFNLLGFTEAESALGLGRPSNILLLNKDSLESFFEKYNELGLARNANSFTLISRSGDATSTPYNAYNFGNIGNIISHYIKQYKEKGGSPVLELLMLPVSIGTSSNSSGTTATTRIYHQMAPTSAIIRTGNNQVKMPLIFSKYNSKKSFD